MCLIRKNCFFYNQKNVSSSGNSELAIVQCGPTCCSLHKSLWLKITIVCKLNHTFNHIQGLFHNESRIQLNKTINKDVWAIPAELVLVTGEYSGSTSCSVSISLLSMLVTFVLNTSHEAISTVGSMGLRISKIIHINKNKE